MGCSAFNDGRGEKVRFNSEADDSAVVGLEFNTAWSPPIIALKTLSERLTRLIFKLHYSDDMMNFKGEATIKGGEVHDVCKDIDLDPKEFENILQIIKDNDK